MSETNPEGQAPSPNTESDDEEPVPFMQGLLDNTFLLLFIGVAIPTVFYTIWGVMEVANIPLAR